MYINFHFLNCVTFEKCITPLGRCNKTRDSTKYITKVLSTQYSPRKRFTAQLFELKALGNIQFLKRSRPAPAILSAYQRSSIGVNSITAYILSHVPG